MIIADRSTSGGVRRSSVTGPGLAFALALALGLAAGACSMGEEPLGARGAAEMQGNSFTFAPPDGTRGVRTERRRYEIALVGTPLRDLEDEVLTWNIAAHAPRGADQPFTIDQELAHAAVKHDGETLIDRDIQPGVVKAQLLVDRAGKLVDVRGLDDASKTLKSLVSPEEAPAAARVFSTENLEALVAIRYEETVGDVVGRPDKVGSSWTTQAEPGRAVVSRTVSVQSLEPCGGATCARLHADYKLDPRTLVTLAGEIVRDYARWSGRAPAKLNVRAALYSMQGTLLTEPATMVNHNAALEESGKVLFAGPKRPMEIDLTGKTEISFDYVRPVSSAGPSPSPALVARP
jgi:hypothetical protein